MQKKIKCEMRSPRATNVVKLFVWYRLIMNIQSKGSKEVLGVEFKDDICSELWFCIFVILLSQDGFESEFPETKFQRITS